jgi:hypothetical protein
MGYEEECTTILCNGKFSDDTCSAQSNITVDIMSKFFLVEIHSK